MVLRRQDALPETGRETFDLVFDARAHVLHGAVGHVAVRPGGVLAAGRAGRVKQAGLDEQHVRSYAEVAQATSRSEAAISSSVPPRCTVADCPTCGLSQGMGASSAQSTLNTPGP